MVRERPESEGGIAAARPATSTRAWWLVAALLITAFLARGPLYLSVFPPFEGWDEHQHLAYIIHLDEAGTIPVLDDTVTPLSLRPLVIAVPHSPSGVDQVRQWGALSYADYWNAPAPPSIATAGDVSFSFRLSSAQHPPLAYVAALPVWRALKATHPLGALHAIRVMNLLLAAAALLLFAAALPRLVPAFAPRVAVLALVCLHPLFFQNVARVANDALALAAGVAGMSVLLLADGRALLTRGLLAAVLIAVSIWSKQTGLTLVPALVIGLPLIGRESAVSAGRLWRVTGVVGIALLLLAAPLWLWSYQHYGSIVTTQESVELAAKGQVVPAMVAALRAIEWTALIETVFVPGRAWVGGWSFLPMHETLAGLYRWSWSAVLLAAVAGGVVVMLRRKRVEREPPAFRGNDAASARLAVCAAVVVFTVLGMLHHAVVSHAVFGRPMTNPWYFMTALPFLYVLVVRGLDAIGRRLALGAAATMALLFVAIDLHGTWFRMPASYAVTSDVAVQWSRLSSIHPAVLSGDLRYLFLAMQLGALCLVVCGLTYVSRRRA